MSTRINWTNPNANFTEIRIYRTDAPFDEANVPATPIVTLTEGTTWLDTTTLQNVYYYYTIGVVVDGELLLSPAQKTIHMPYTGPGPQELQCGDWSRGYFGLVNNTELFTPTELCALCGVGGPNVTAWTWVKFVRNGKILFMNLLVMTAGKYVSWNALYNLGLIYGMTGPGPATGHGNAPVDQRKVVTKGEHSFIVRLPRGLDTPDYSVGPVQPSQGEINPLYLAVMNQSLAGGGDALGDFLKSTYVVSDYAAVAEFTGNNCMHLDASLNLTAASGNCTRALASYWRPILELVL